MFPVFNQSQVLSLLFWYSDQIASEVQICSSSAHTLGPMYITSTSHYSGHFLLVLMQKLRAWPSWRPSSPQSPRGGSGIIYKGLSGRRQENAARSEWRFCHNFGGLHRTLNADRQSAEPCGSCQSLPCALQYGAQLCFRPQKLHCCRTDHDTCMASARMRYVAQLEIWATRQSCMWQQQ